MSVLNWADLPRRINVGCGYDHREGYLNIDVDPACNPDVIIHDNDLSIFPTRHFDEVRAWDVLEHIPHTFTMPALLDWAALLKTGGTLVIQTSYVFGVIDCMRMSPSFEADYNWNRCLFGNQAHPGDFHHSGFTDRTLRTYLFNAGFRVPRFEIVDGWLIQCNAVKVRDWMTALDMNAEDTLKSAYHSHLRRDIDQDTLSLYMKDVHSGRDIRDLLKEIISAPECLYKLGAELDLDPVRASL